MWKSFCLCEQNTMQPTKQICSTLALLFSQKSNSSNSSGVVQLHVFHAKDFPLPHVVSFSYYNPSSQNV